MSHHPCLFISNITLSRYTGAANIALATSITVMLGCVLYAVLIRRFFRQEDRSTPTYPLVRELAKTLLATIPVASIAWVGQT